MGSGITTLLPQYIDSKQPASDALKKALEAITPEERYKLLVEVQGSQSKENCTAVLAAAFERDLEGLICMLDGFTSEQKFNVLKVSNGVGATPLYLACNKRQASYSTNYSPKDIVQYLISDLSPRQKFDLLKLQHSNGTTILFSAVSNNYMDCVLLLLSSLSLGQQQQLLTIKSEDGYSTTDACGPALLETMKVLSITTQKLGAINAQVSTLEGEKEQQRKELNAMKKTVETQAAEIDFQKVEILEHKAAIAAQTEEIATVKNQLRERKDAQLSLLEKCIRQEQDISELKQQNQLQSDFIQWLREEQQVMMSSIEELQIGMKTPILIDQTEDQDNQDDFFLLH